MGWDQNYNNDDNNGRTFPKKKQWKDLKVWFEKKGTIYVIESAIRLKIKLRTKNLILKRVQNYI